MRAKCFLLVLLIGGLALVLEPTSSLSQDDPPVPGNRFEGKRKGRPRFRPDDAPDRRGRGDPDKGWQRGAFPKMKGKGRDGWFQQENDRPPRGRLDRSMEPTGSGNDESMTEGSVEVSSAPLPGEEDGSKPVVYRAGKLPPGLPDWFTQLDTDRDGQVGLYEWKHSGRPLEEFHAMDRNGDGFLTVEEVLRYIRQESNPRARTAGQ